MIFQRFYFIKVLQVQLGYFGLQLLDCCLCIFALLSQPVLVVLLLLSNKLCILVVSCLHCSFKPGSLVLIRLDKPFGLLGMFGSQRVDFLVFLVQQSLAILLFLFEAFFKHLLYFLQLIHTLLPKQPYLPFRRSMCLLKHLLKPLCSFFHPGMILISFLLKSF